MNLIHSEVMKMEFISDNYHRRIVNTYKELLETDKKLRMMQSALDRQISDIYHTIEKTSHQDLDAIAYTSELKRLLTRRRVVKDEMARMKPFVYIARNTLEDVERRYEGALLKSFELRQQLNVTMSVEEVAAEMGVEGLR
ncbi:hypothetical protein LCL96_12505 [Rossellomorea aquimaris]|uniref:hypothetical protein n=1 Tax=Rossellomorea aquimaris TaxID=189382 RepID=UPI001CD2EFE4|nr:hypothetical protein [Rossellomorea aquimaris]MCA1059769.1 hypothetical protein [Rossellomorea aquimaris]